MAILFFTEGPSTFGSATTCSESPRRSKTISLQDLKNLTRDFFDRTQLTDMPEDLKNKLLVGCRFPINEVAMLISQNPDAEYLQVNYAIDSNGKHFHYMVAAKKEAAIQSTDTTLIIEDCCRIPPNTVSIQSFF